MNIIRRYSCFSIIPVIALCLMAWKSVRNDQTFFSAADKKFQYVGRIDFSNPALPRFWAPAVYIKASFRGPYCEIQLNDEELYGNVHNFISVVIDDMPAKRIKLTAKQNSVIVADGLPDTRHNVMICKGTEADIGYLEFVGMKCKKLLTPPSLPARKIEYIGDSMTCGSASDVSLSPCNTGQWYDQNNAYGAYGPTTATALNAQWHLTSVSGIGLTRSCCNRKLVMPDVFDKIDFKDNKINWNFKLYQPDVVTVCLGQNDGFQDSVTFCSAYHILLKQLRTYYPAATIVCLSSPMANAKLLAMQKNWLSGIVTVTNANGDNNVFKYFFRKQYHNGCQDHPNLTEHQEIAQQLTAFIKTTKSW